ncbi:MAG: DUF559 domain-containing protein [Planctomycetaceae bacterium]|nr:DUF559 domain-containing protein [Planctomycetaceae bacterium]
MTKAFNRKTEKSRRRYLRNNMPQAEVILWSRLKGKQLQGQKFRRQFSVGPYILGFYCPRLKLAIELDGDSHFKEGAKSRDKIRDNYLSEYAIEIVRITNDEIFDNLDNVLEMLANQVSNLLNFDKS